MNNLMPIILDAELERQDNATKRCMVEILSKKDLIAQGKIKVTDILEIIHNIRYDYHDRQEYEESLSVLAACCLINLKVGDMNRNEFTTLSKLDKGDRFYKAGDKNKKVFEVLGIIKNRYAQVTHANIAEIDRFGDLSKHKIVSKPETIGVIYLRTA